MADYFTVVDLKTRSSGYRSIFNCEHGRASFIVLFILKKTMGLRVTKEEEIDGLDIHEHGTNVYND
jgi:ammonia channel protein AmtB